MSHAQQLGHRPAHLEVVGFKSQQVLGFFLLLSSPTFHHNHNSPSSQDVKSLSLKDILAVLSEDLTSINKHIMVKKVAMLVM